MPYLAILFFSLISAFSQADSLPQDSIYQLDAKWQNAQGKTMPLANLQGKKQVVAMFYSHCLTACPVIVADLQKIERALNPKQKKDLGFVLVSLDTERETVDSLNAFAKKRQLDEHWQLLLGTKDDIRSLSMLLNVRYQDTDDGEIAHSKLLHVVDEKGRLLFQTSSVDDVNQLIEQMDL